MFDAMWSFATFQLWRAVRWPVRLLLIALQAGAALAVHSLALRLLQ